MLREVLMARTVEPASNRPATGDQQPANGLSCARSARADTRVERPLSAKLCDLLAERAQRRTIDAHMDKRLGQSRGFMTRVARGA